MMAFDLSKPFKMTWTISSNIFMISLVFSRLPPQTVDVVVAKSQYGHKYLKTVADGEQPNNLLSLPECY